jgi:hypothetical protein
MLTDVSEERYTATESLVHIQTTRRYVPEDISVGLLYTTLDYYMIFKRWPKTFSTVKDHFLTPSSFLDTLFGFFVD